MRYFLGADVGSTKTHMAVAGEDGRVIAFAQSGAGNYQSAGYDGMLLALQDGLAQLLAAGSFALDDLAGAGFGVAGYDWPSDFAPLTAVIDQLDLPCPYEMVNDAMPALLACARGGWGVALVSGTGCNCRGRDREHKREGVVTGFGILTGEGAGATELVFQAMRHVAHEWTMRGPATALTPALIDYAGAKDLADLVEGYCQNTYDVGPQAARLIFDVARQGDPVAQQVIHWAGVELGELANAVIRQLDIAEEDFDVVLAGSMFDGGPLLTDPMWQTILRLAPRAKMVRMDAPPVAGAIILGMEQVGLRSTKAIRHIVSLSLQAREWAKTRPGKE